VITQAIVITLGFIMADAFDTEQLLDCLEKLKSCLPIQIPVYDFKRHQRSLDMVRKVNAADVIILEGILVFHDARVRGLMNMKIFVDTGLSIFFLHFGCLSQYLLSNSC
jgi:uridine kinase